MLHRRPRTKAVLCVFLCVLLSLSLFSCKKGSDVPLSPGLSVIAGEPVYEKDVAMRTEHFTVTPGMMAYFFYTYGNTVMAQMQANKSYDAKKSLHDQMYTDTLSFYDVIMNETVDKVTKLLVCCEGALAEQALLTDEENARVQETVANYRMAAAANYGKTLGEYLRSNYGDKIAEEDFVRVLELELLANRFSLELKARLEGEITKEQAREYAAANGLSDSTPSRNITYLFLPFENGAAPEGKIEEAYAALEGAPSSETLLGLSALGTAGSEYNLTPENSGIEGIGSWLFADGRRLGDYGRVDTAGAVYILLYSGEGIPTYEVAARMELFDISYANWYNTLVNALHFGYNYDCLDSYDIDKK